jgi:hypothetical protein
VNLKRKYNLGVKSRWEDGVKMYLKELTGLIWLMIETVVELF